MKTKTPWAVTWLTWPILFAFNAGLALRATAYRGNYSTVLTTLLITDVLVLVTDGASEYRIPYPCWLTKALGWMNSSQGDRAESRPNGRPAKT